MVSNLDKSKKVAISTGHSTQSMGAISPIDGTKEYDLNVLLTQTIMGFHLIPSFEWWRSDEDYDEEPYPQHLRHTVDNINSTKDVVCCLEVHHNAFKDPTVRGAEIYYWDTSQLGYLFAKKVAEWMGNVLDGCKIYPNMKRLGKKNKKYFLWKTNPPAIILEPGYLTNKEDLYLMEQLRVPLGEAIRSGVVDFLETCIL